MINIIKNITILNTFIFIGFYIVYFLICLSFTIIKNNKKRGSYNLNIKNYSNISIIIPTYNESNVIANKIKNLQNMNYPKNKLEIIFVDGGSTDNTADKLNMLAKNNNLSIKLIRQKSRKGFNNAVIEGFYQSSGEIIIVTGAETEFDRDTLTLFTRHFADPKVGVVTGVQKVKNFKDNLSPKLEVAYRNLYDFIREAESKIDSPFDIKGEISACRRDIWKKLVENTYLKNKGAIDICLSFQARKDEYKTIFDPEIFYYELAPRSLKELFKQRIRRAAVLIQDMLVYKDMILRKKYGAFGMIIMPAHFLMLIILPFFFIIALVGALFVVIYEPSNFFFVLMVSIGLLVTFISKSLQAFVQAQVVLFVTSLKLLSGIETQKFERLLSARPELSKKGIEM